MKYAGPIAFFPLILFCVNASGGVITSSVTCSITNNDPRVHQTQIQTSTSSCGLMDTSITALTSGLFSTGSVSAGPFFMSLQGREQAGGWLFDENVGSDWADLEIRASYDATILSNGPVRDGLLSIYFSAGGDWSPSGGAYASVNFGSYSNYVGAGRRSTFDMALVPVTLGVPLNLQLRSGVYAGIVGDYFAVGLSENLSFSFLELDRTTEVEWKDVTATPEPDAAWLSALGIVFIAIRKVVTARMV